MFFRIAVLLSILLYSACCVLADTFSSYTILKEDRAGFHISLPAVEEKTLHKIKKSSQTKQHELKSVYDINVDDVFNKDLRYLIAQDKQNLLFEESLLSNNKLLLLSYASPAMADILKHYRMVALERMQLEYNRHSPRYVENKDMMEVFFQDSNNRCIYREKGRGLITASEVCRQKEPFAYIKNSSGWYVSEQRPWEILKDLLSRVGLSPAITNLVISLVGDVVVTPAKIQQKSSTKSFKEEVDLYTKNQIDVWKSMMSKVRKKETILEVDLENVSCLGNDVSISLIHDLLMLKPAEEEIFIMKFSKNCSILELHSALKESVLFFEGAKNWLGLEKGAVKVLENRQIMLEKMLFNVKSNDLLQQGQLLLRGVMESADVIRELLL